MIDAADLSKHVIRTGHRRYPYRALLFNVTSVYALLSLLLWYTPHLLLMRAIRGKICSLVT